MLFDEDVAARSRRKKKRLSSVFSKLQLLVVVACIMQQSLLPQVDSSMSNHPQPSQPQRTRARVAVAAGVAALGFFARVRKLWFFRHGGRANALSGVRDERGGSEHVKNGSTQQR